ncbi:MAG: hypothetical protein J6P40_02220 [Oscillospiraceae bacterium]|nr:hypothetical protein [Oscillospiraceae bacterium]
MADRPACTECKYCHLRKAHDTVGWGAFCTARSRNGRIIDNQYGLRLDWTLAELKDKLSARVCPKWCPEWGRV